MPELPTKKVGLIACCGEEMPEGTVTRLAVRKVLESLRPQHTVTICLPLFLAGGEGERAFARLHPTITVDGCEKQCAARGTAMYSGKPAASVVVNQGSSADYARLGTARRLTQTGMQVVGDVADQIVRHVDQLLDLKWDRRAGTRADSPVPPAEPQARQGSCSCGSGIPVTTLHVAGRKVALVALPLIFAQFRAAGKLPGDSTKAELLQAVKVYNPVPDADEEAYAQAVLQEYSAFVQRSH